ncbi:hypothetical protein B0H13DRAFT_2578099 [Mycena leptocephala]|nr:hypothetical protein B0H13DRAFT_2578099 [Mycena leptocephala]
MSHLPRLASPTCAYLNAFVPNSGTRWCTPPDKNTQGSSRSVTRSARRVVRTTIDSHCPLRIPRRWHRHLGLEQLLHRRPCIKIVEDRTGRSGSGTHSARVASRTSSFRPFAPSFSSVPPAGAPRILALSKAARWLLLGKRSSYLNVEGPLLRLTPATQYFYAIVRAPCANVITLRGHLPFRPATAPPRRAACTLQSPAPRMYPLTFRVTLLFRLPLLPAPHALILGGGCRFL